MLRLPAFIEDGVLPPGDFELSISELKKSMLVRGPENRPENHHWDNPWKMKLIENLEIMVRQLNQVGISEIFVDGSFVEDKDHPSDMDGYFVCDHRHLVSGDLEKELNFLDPHKAWTWDPELLISSVMNWIFLRHSEFPAEMILRKGSSGLEGCHDQE